MRAMAIVVVRGDLSRSAFERVLLVALAAVQIDSLFQSRIDHRDADVLAAGAVHLHRVEPECLEESTWSAVASANDRGIRSHDGVRRNVRDVGIRVERVEIVGVNRCGECVDDRGAPR